ncbi:class I SAM-dependent methyltransferase [Amycolatopsis nigrescens]|uniref:class I SAM-dependent methyltransferase n=1 Tax=Amycolatopsis nigrescens TaxID=381445 RepID=UPI0003625D60|nr:class I SAM-dependent methyltransferase [Amycolatopsis nigrescens]
MGDVGALTAWAEQLAAWVIPAEVLARAEESPWVLPRPVFVRRADAQIAEPAGATFAEALAALDRPGTVLDVGAAAGASSLPLAGRAPVTSVTAVDVDETLLATFAERAGRLGLAHRLVPGRWPEQAERAGVADVVLCGNVVYNVPDLGPFVTALTGCARRRVVLELAASHPLVELNPLWQRFHGITRPDGPTADDCVAALTELGIRPRVVRWNRPPRPEHAGITDLVDVTRRRLCLPASATAEVAAALRERGVDPSLPPDLGSSGRALVTLSWPGTAA